jgi:hypothetical protein
MKTLLNDTINTKDINDDDYASSGNAFNDALGAGVPPSVPVSVPAVATVPPAVAAVQPSVATGVATATITVDTDGSGLIPAANSINPKQKFSSSMKFYLLKKKFMKQNTCYNACLENDLSYEDYLIT